MKRLPLLIGILLLLLAACEKDIEFNGEVTNPLMVINALVPQDSLFEIKVTQSRFFLQNEDTFVTVKNATVELFINGVFVETMPHAGNGRYTSGYRVTDGDLIRIVSQAPDLKTTTAEMRVAPTAEIVKLDTTMVIHSRWPIIEYSNYGQVDTNYGDTIGWNTYCTVNCKLTFHDPPGSENFYRLIISKKLIFDYYNVNQVWYEKNDLVFGENQQNSGGIIDEGGSNMYGTFTDELFEGKNYPLTFSFDVGSTNYLDSIQQSGSYRSDYNEFSIDLQMLSKSYYLYLITSSKYTADDLFAEPVQIHSNVTGGTGIVGNYSHRLIPLKLPF